MAPSYQTIALFGANGQVGKYVFNTLIEWKESEFRVIAFVSPNSDFRLNQYGGMKALEERLDLHKITVDDLAVILAHHNVDVIVSTLGHAVINKQGVIQDAAAKAGVKRFYPSEFGMHQIPWFPGEGGYLHPTWAVKIKCLDDAIKHPAIQSGKMTYTVIGCAEMYDMPDEPILCPWLEKDELITKKGYQVQCVGNPDAKMDYSCCADVAKYLVASIQHPERSENKILGFRSDFISYSEITQLLEKHSGKKARLNVTSIEQVKTIVKDPSTAPAEFQRGSTFPVDFWILLRYVQGQGTFWRPPGLLSNDLFPEVTPTSMEAYFKSLFEK
ncbi:NAD(P)-binding protein [Penicillium malachiteum]|uniref:NAD(P)-binding protein n=1 Tax=Penicillium malachiteum TaxID=1324776 RepID=A0AAD6MS02_9EURO|nr:NAD(P)-binding protein [Penicillium malachiteum]